MDNKINIIICIYLLTDKNIDANTTLIRKKTKVSMPTLSNILKQLIADDIITLKIKGKFRYYNLTKKGYIWSKLLNEANEINKL